MLRNRHWIVLFAAAFVGNSAVTAEDPGSLSLGSVLAAVGKDCDDKSRGQMTIDSELFIDIFNAHENIQIAFVIDGTRSMQKEIDSVKNGLSELSKNVAEREKGGKIEFAVFVFRDFLEAQQGKYRVVSPVDAVVPEFTTDVEAVSKALNDVKARGGAPFLPESIDRGIHAALTMPNWRDGEDVSRWIIVCGDAPPHTAATIARSRRAYASSLLAGEEIGEFQVDPSAFSKNSLVRFTAGRLSATARENGISISGFTCRTAKPAGLPKAVVSQIPKARKDATSYVLGLANATDGKFLDAFDSDTVSRLTTHISKPFQRIAPITPAQIVEMANDAGVAPPVRIAVVPPSNNDGTVRLVSFNANTHSSRIATQMRDLLKRMDRVHVVSPRKVKSIFDQQSQQIDGKASNANYVVTSELGSETSLKAVLRDCEGTVICECKVNGNREDLARSAVNDLRKKAARKLADTDPAAAKAFQSADGTAKRHFDFRFANNLGAQQLVADGMDHLERSLEFDNSDAAPNEYLKRAEHLGQAYRKLRSAYRIEPQSAAVNLYLANLFAVVQKLDKTRFPIKSQLVKKQTELVGKTSFEAIIKLHLDQAIKVLEENPSPLFDEAQGDRCFLVGSSGDGVPFYQRLQSRTDGFGLRANWMLAGYYLGDFQGKKDLVKARDCILRILAVWPDSSQAKFFRKWVNEDGRNPGYNPFVPLPTNEPLFASRF